MTIYGKSKNELPAYYQNDQPQENEYVRVIVNATPFKDGKIILCHHLQKIKNFNEVTNHNLSVIQAHLHRTKGFLNKPEEVYRVIFFLSFSIYLFCFLYF